MAKFADFADEKPFTGDKISITDLIGKEITVVGFRISDSTKRVGTKCLMMSIIVDGQERVCFTGSMVLIDLITKYQDNIPFETTIKQVNKFLTFT